MLFPLQPFTIRKVLSPFSSFYFEKVLYSMIIRSNFQEWKRIVR